MAGSGRKADFPATLMHDPKRATHAGSKLLICKFSAESARTTALGRYRRSGYALENVRPALRQRSEFKLLLLPASLSPASQHLTFRRAFPI